MFGTFIFLLLKSTQNLSLAQTAFFAMFSFTYFGKQYSMQYVLWLAPLAVMTIASLPKKYILPATYAYGAWQGFELLFRITYFQNGITNISASRATPLPYPISDCVYGTLAFMRYTVLMISVVIVAKFTLLRTSTPVNAASNSN